MFWLRSRKKRLLFPLIIAVVLLVGGTIGSTSSSFVDTEDSTDNVNRVVTNWYDLAWGYRKPVTINNGGPALTDYQVKVTVNTEELIDAGKMQPDGNDIRFTESDGYTEMPYWLESGIDTTSTVIWVRVPSIPSGDSTIYIYYDNDSASGASSVSSTFPSGSFEDLFNNSWAVNGGDSSGVAFTPGEVELVVGDEELADESQVLNSSNQNVYGSQWVGQTFYAGLSGALSKVTLRARVVGTVSSPLEVQVRDCTVDDKPGSTVYASASRGDITTSYRYEDFVFGVAASLTAGTKYAIVIKTTGGDASNRYQVRFQNSEAYSSGRRCTSSNGGGTWSGTTTDFYFITYVTTEWDRDQQQTGSNANAPVHGDQWLGQSFVAGMDGDLTAVAITASAIGSPPNDLTVEVRDAEEIIEDVLDQSQTSGDNPYAVYGSTYVGQTFQAGTSGPLSKVTLRASETGSPTGDMFVELRNVVQSSEETVDQSQTLHSGGERQVFATDYLAQIFKAELTGELTAVSLWASETGTPPNALTVEVRDVVDDSEESVDQGETSQSANYSVYGDRWLAQTFEAGRSGILTKVTLRMRTVGTPPNGVEVQLWTATAGDLPDALISGATVTRSDITSSYVDYEFEFATPPAVTQGEAYAVVVKTSGGNSSNYYRLMYRNQDVHPGGRKCTSTDGGSSWAGQAEDLYFVVYIPMVETLDQSQTQADSFAAVNGTQYLAQTFQSGYSGVLTKVTVVARAVGTPPASLDVELRDCTGGDLPGTTVYASASRSDIGSAFAAYDFTFSSPPSVVEGTKYSIVVGTASGDASNYYDIGYQNSDVYGDGRACASGDGGSTWTGYPVDMYFQTFVGVEVALDQSQTSADASVNVYGTQYVAQTFTAGYNGSLTKVTIEAMSVGSPPNDLEVQLRDCTVDDLPGTTVYASASRSDIGGSFATYDFTFASPPSVSKDARYAIVILTAGGDASNYYDVSYQSSDVYANGRACASGDGGNTWIGYPVDLYFQTHVDIDDIDQSQTALDRTFAVYGTRWWAQTFEAGLSGDLTKVTLRLRKVGSPPNAVVVEIRDCTGSDLPGTQVYASASKYPADIGTGLATYDFVFASPAGVTAGTKYSIVVKTESGDSDNKYVVGYIDGDLYSSGRRCRSLDGGSSWTGQTGDLYFQTYVGVTKYIPGSTVYATTSRSDIGTTAQEYDFTYSTPYTVTADTRYAIVVRTTGGDAGNRYNIGYEGSDAYADGNEASSTDSGGSWTASPNTDLYFVTKVTLDIGDTPGSTVYATTSRRDISVDAYYDFVFGSPYTVTSGTNYAIVVYTTGSDASNNYSIYYDTADPYGLGKACISDNGGSSWTPYDVVDIQFSTYIRTATGKYGPGSTVYATSSRSDIGSLSQEYDFVLGSPVNVTNGTRYTVVVKTSGGDVSNYYDVAYQTNDVYGSGILSYTTDGGSTWSRTAYDLLFTTYVDAEKAISASGVLRSVTVPVDQATRFAVGIQFSWNDTEQASSDIVYQLEYYTGAAWALVPDSALPGNSTGFDSSPVGISTVLTDYGQVRLRANLSSTYSGDVPSIQDWTVTYYYREYSDPEPTMVGVGGEE